VKRSERLWGNRSPSAKIPVSMDDLQVSAKEVSERLGRGDKLLLVDVREQWEYDLCKIPGAKLIPLGTIPANLNTLLDVDDDVICYCHHGMRSLDAAVWLRQQGVESAKSMAGGIERWSAEVDPSVPRY
jgi:rhodanese-related sulfurtransferase